MYINRVLILNFIHKTGIVYFYTLYNLFGDHFEDLLFQQIV